MNELREKLYQAVYRNLGGGLLLSGGLDSSIIAAIAPETKTFTVALEQFGSDRYYAKLLAEKLNLKNYTKIISIEEALSAIPTIIKILRTFDPAIPNDLAIYFGLKLAKEHRIKTVMTGDGGDELFVGYAYMQRLNLDEYIPSIVRNMCFSAKALGKFLGINVKQPYLDNEFVEFAVKIPSNLKVIKWKGKTWGKWALRKTFESVLPSEIIWRDKTAIEYGSGTTKLREIITAKISDTEFQEKKQIYPIKFISKEHLFYYEIYQDVVGKIPKPRSREKECCVCGAGLQLDASHCKICGGYPV